MFINHDRHDACDLVVTLAEQEPSPISTRWRLLDKCDLFPSEYADLSNRHGVLKEGDLRGITGRETLSVNLV
jgi:hypothetical protein